MDSVPRYEFHAIFDRVSSNIDLEGCTSALAIELALKEVRDQSKAKAKINRTAARRMEFGKRAEWLDTLLEHDFAGRAIFEARRNPQGSIALTLIYGRQQARQRIEAQKKAALRSRLTYRHFPQVPIPKKIPELRRKPTFRRRKWLRRETP